MLLSVMLLVTLMVIALTVEAPRIAQQIKREKEEELIHRGNEYKNAIKKYFRKFGQYPVSLDQLKNTNNMRFLRKRYVDPFTGKDDWRLLHPGEVQVNPVAGGATATGQQPGQPVGGTLSAIGQPGSINTPSTGPSPGSPSTSPFAGPSTSPQPGTNQSGNSAFGTGGITPAGNLPGASSSSPILGGGPIIGVSSVSKLKSIKEINGKDHYNDWQFVYDPRLEMPTAGVVPGAQGANPVGGTVNPVGGVAPGQQQPGQMNPLPVQQQPGQMNPPPMQQQQAPANPPQQQ